MSLDQPYLDAIKGFEGFAPQASWDYKQHSNGYGTRALYPGEQIDRDTAEQRFQAEIAKAAAHVDQIAPNAPPGARAALVSLTYNAGPGWANSGLGDLVRAGDWQGASQRLLEYNKAGGEVNPGLVNRRTKEAAWFNAPPSAGSPAAQVPMNLGQGQAAKPFAMPSFFGMAGQPQPQAQEQQTDPYSQLGGPPQLSAMQPLGGAPRRPADFSRLKAMLARKA